MNDVKFWWQSRAVWGGLIAIMGGLGPLVGWVIDEQTQATLTEVLTNIAVLVGGLLAVVGRTLATSQVATKKSVSAGDDSGQ